LLRHSMERAAPRPAVSADFLVQDNGEPDATAPQAEQDALEDLPMGVLLYLLGRL
jgi:hypothetical protein